MLLRSVTNEGLPLMGQEGQTVGWKVGRAQLRHQALTQLGRQSWTLAGELGCKPNSKLSMDIVEKGQLSRP